MDTIELSPYLTPTSSSILKTEFFAGDNQIGEKAPWSQVPNWHQGIDVELRAIVILDLKQALIECGLAANAALSIALVARCRSTKLKTISNAIAIEGQNTIEVILPAGEFAKKVEISLLLFTGEMRKKDSVDKFAAPSFSVLWQQNLALELEGSSGRIEIFAEDFENTNTPRAIWNIQTDFSDDPNEWQIDEVNSRVRIMYNQKKADEIRSSETKVLLKTAYIQAILDGVSSRPEVIEFLLDKNFDYASSGSLAITARQLILNIFGDVSAETVVSLWTFHRETFTSQIQNMVAPR
jgi:hypothetical protein